MKTNTIRIQEEEAIIIPIGDIHIGDKNFTQESLKELKKEEVVISP
jgi:hypothetical protein